MIMICQNGLVTRTSPDSSDPGDTGDSLFNSPTAVFQFVRFWMRLTISELSKLSPKFKILLERHRATIDHKGLAGHEGAAVTGQIKHGANGIILLSASMNGPRADYAIGK